MMTKGILGIREWKGWVRESLIRGYEHRKNVKFWIGRREKGSRKEGRKKGSRVKEGRKDHEMKEGLKQMEERIKR